MPLTSKRCLILASSALLLLSFSAIARPITHEDVWLMPRVGNPVLSPNGALAVVSVTMPSYERSEQTSDLWLTEPTNPSAAPRQLTFTQGGESQVVWSPDGSAIAFRARREGDEAPQIYLLSLTTGGEARRLTQHPNGAAEPSFSPDGTHIAFVSQVDVTNSTENNDGALKGVNVRTYTGFPIRNWNRWLDGKKPRLFVQKIGETQSLDLIGDSKLVKMLGFAGSRSSSGAQLNPIWTPDGKSLIFSASDNRHRYAFDFTDQDLWLVSATGGEPVRLTGDLDPAGDDSYGSHSFTPDGKHLVATMSPRTDRVFNGSSLVVWTWPEAKRINEITLPERRGFGGYSLPGNGRIYALGQDAGHVKIYEASLLDDQEATLSFDVSSGIYSGLQGVMRAGELVMVAGWQASHQPAEVVALNLSTKNHKALTHFTRESIAGLDLAPVEHFWYENSDGMDIHSLLVKPANFDPDKKYPVIALMHGGPHSMWRDYFFVRWNYHLLAREDFVLILTNYRGSTGFGEGFAQAIQGDPLRGPANDINEAVDAAAARYSFIDKTKQCAAGASYGGHLANWMQSSTDRYRCLVSHAGLVNLATQWGTSDAVYHREANLGGPPWEIPDVWAEQNPINFASSWKTPVLVTIGMRDERVPLANSLEYWTALQRQQVESRLLVYPDEDHWIMSGPNSRHFYGELDNWLRRWLLDD
jgi:dipeptidyl aminopeptidase/acylaminoacyl peptidase